MSVEKNVNELMEAMPPDFTMLEHAVLEEICAQDGVLGADLKAQLAAAKVVGRRNTGAGFYTDISVDRSAVPPLNSKGPIGEVWAEIEGFVDPMTFLIFVEDGYVVCLEGATVRDRTVNLDLSAVKFAILRN